MRKRIVRILALVLAVSLLAGCKPLFDRNVKLDEMTVKIPREYTLDKHQSEDGFLVYERDGYSGCIILSKNEAVYTLQDYITAMRDAECKSDIGKLGDTECAYSSYNVDERPCEEVLFIYNGSAYSVALRSGEAGEFDALTASIKVK